MADYFSIIVFSDTSHYQGACNQLDRDLQPLSYTTRELFGNYYSKEANAEKKKIVHPAEKRSSPEKAGKRIGIFVQEMRIMLSCKSWFV
jgi:hypothetical protein